MPSQHHAASSAKASEATAIRTSVIRASSQSDLIFQNHNSKKQKQLGTSDLGPLGKSYHF